MTGARAVTIEDFGPPSVMKVKSFDLAPPGVGEVQVRQTAIGFNFIDIYQRRGIYPLPLPTGLGHEAAGFVEAIGPGVDGLQLGDRIVYMNAGIGAYASLRNVAASKLVKLPEGISDEVAAALFFKGMTAQYLLHKTHRVAPGELIFVHAAAGGVGQILVRWAKALGATVAGTAGSSEKCEIARAAGCDIVLDYSKPDWVNTFLDATNGRKAQVVYDSVGKDTFLKSLDCTAPFGLVVLYGAASGPVAPFDPELLNKKGGLFLTRPSVFPHNADPQIFSENAAVLFAALASGAVKAEIGARFSLDDIVKAHDAAESRATTASIILTP